CVHSRCELALKLNRQRPIIAVMNSENSRTGTAGRRARRWSLVLAGAMIVTFLALSATPASAATLTNVSWSVSNNQAGATGVTYSYSFTTATTGTIKTITFAVSGSGLAGTPAIARHFGIGAGTVAPPGPTVPSPGA